MENNELRWEDWIDIDEKIEIRLKKIDRSADRMRKLVKLNAPYNILNNEARMAQRWYIELLQLLDLKDSEKNKATKAESD